MGNRHQVFLIARLVPHSNSASNKNTRSYYRCITAHHNQNCCGRQPLSAVRRFINLLQNPDNAEIIRDELRRAQGRYGRQGRRPHVHALGFPYAQYLLTQAWDMDLDHPENPHASGAGLESDVISPNGSCFGHDNDDGITIIDVTDPVNPAFCHVRDGDGPLSPQQYVRQYHPIPPKEDIRASESGRDVTDKDEEDRFVLEDVLRHIASLEGIPLLSRVVLAEPSPRSPTLLLVLQWITVFARTIGPDLNCFFGIPAKATLIKQALYSKRPFPDAGIVALSRALSLEMKKNGGVLDLVGTLFSLEQLRVLTTTVPADIVRTVRLNGQQTLEPNIIGDLTNIFPNLIRIDLLDTNISDEQILDLCRNQPQALYQLHHIIHPAFLIRTPPTRKFAMPSNVDEVKALAEQLSNDGSHGFTFHQSRIHRINNDDETFASIHFFHPETVLAGLTRYFNFLKNGREKTHRFTFAFGLCQHVPAMVLSYSLAPDLHGHTTSLATDKASEDRQHWLHRTVTGVPMSASYNPFMARGWLFVVRAAFYFYEGPEETPKYAFVKIDEAAHKAWLVDLFSALLEDRLADQGNVDDSSESEEEEEEEEEEVQRDGGTRELQVHRPSSRLPCSLPHPRVSALSSDAWKVYDARGFADAVAKEGRPRPSEEAIAASEESLQVGKLSEMEKRLGAAFGVEARPFTLMGHDEVKEFIPAAR
ncbi:hypothetical protein Moror_5922 [Moniliophthora roreri MCA 2997]|uniref:Uncharacterized protein n=1 Tax=Moniliophthora roreri (strain MCA 2997) TaxID=1381753 RepID=V2WEW7_MONRO|nr:hypothetical protein Moror_5922 [Moniliophthora roreri MCA 2997]